MQLWDLRDLQWDRKFLPYQFSPGLDQESSESCYHFMLNAKEGKAFTCFSADSLHTTLEIKPASLHATATSGTFTSKQGSRRGLTSSSGQWCAQLVPICSPTEETLMNFLGRHTVTPYLQIDNDEFCVWPRLDRYPLPTRLLKGSWLFLCHTATIYCPSGLGGTRSNCCIWGRLSLLA